MLKTKKLFKTCKKVKIQKHRSKKGQFWWVQNIFFYLQNLTKNWNKKKYNFPKFVLHYSTLFSKFFFNLLQIFVIPKTAHYFWCTFNPNPRGPFWSLTSRVFIAIFGSWESLRVRTPCYTLGAWPREVSSRVLGLLCTYCTVHSRLFFAI